MPKKYTVRDNSTGKSITFSWDSDVPPNDNDLEEIFSEAREYSNASDNTPDVSSPEYLSKVSSPSFIKKFMRGVKNEGMGLKDIIEKNNTFKSPSDYLYNLTKIITEDVPEEAKGIYNRTNQRFNRLNTPTTTEKVVGEAVENISPAPLKGFMRKNAEVISGVPEDVLRGAGAVIGTAGEIPGAVVSLGSKAASRVLGDVPGIVGTYILDKATSTDVADKLGKWWYNLSPEERVNFETALDMTNIIGAKAPKGFGSAVENTGKKFLGGQLKIKDSIAKRALGSNRLDLSKAKILDNISKYNLESVKGNFGSMADKALDQARARTTEADNILRKIASSKNAPRGQFVDDIIQQAMEDIPELSAVGKEPLAEKVLNDVLEGSYTRGLSGSNNIGVEDLVEFKRKLDPDGNLMALGPAPNDADALDRKIRKELYLRTMDKINSISEKAGMLNREAKELFDISAVASDAASRTSSRNPVMSATNALIGSAGGGSAITAAALQKPEVAVGSILGSLGLAAAANAGAQGRGPASLMELGKLIQRIPTGASAGIVSDATRIPIETPTYSEEAGRQKRIPETIWGKKKRAEIRDKYQEYVPDDIDSTKYKEELYKLLPMSGRQLNPAEEAKLWTEAIMRRTNGQSLTPEQDWILRKTDPAYGGYKEPVEVTDTTPKSMRAILEERGTKIRPDNPYELSAEEYKIPWNFPSEEQQNINLRDYARDGNEFLVNATLVNMYRAKLYKEAGKNMPDPMLEKQVMDYAEEIGAIK